MNTITLNGNKVDCPAEITISDLLRQMNFTFPMLVIKINGQLIKKADYADVTVPAGAEVAIIHLISGG
jgi:thiamine biosynthesis protein ThiS